MPPVDEVVDALIQQDNSVLFVDTCSILDVLRFPVRRSLNDWLQYSGLFAALLSDHPPMALIISSQVQTEFNRRLKETMDELKEAEKQILKLVKSLQQGFERPTLPSNIGLGAAFGEVCNGIYSKATVVIEDDYCKARAMDRVLESRRPCSQQGKSGYADCCICEQVVQLAFKLRSKDFTKEIIFLSSNTDDYLLKRSLAPDVAQSFAPHRIEYASDWLDLRKFIELQSN